MTYTLDYVLFERTPVILVILAAVAWYLMMSRALRTMILPALAERRERRRYERHAATADRTELITLPARGRPSPRREAA